MRLVLAAAAVLGLVTLCPAGAAAEVRRGAYRFQPGLDLPVMAATAPVLAVWFLGNEFPAAHCAPRCDPSTLNGLDRPFAGRYAPRWQTVSDVGILAFGLGAAAGLALHEGLPDSLADTAVVLESVMVANATAILFNYAVRRPRPLVYGDAAPVDARLRGNASLSFFSGHTANAFALAVGLFQVLRHTARPAVAWTALGVGLSLAGFIGASRVAAGAHFPSDVIAGAVVGASMGWLVPALHARRVGVAPMALGDGAGVSVHGMF
jgi:membrane-associated phospholipid phosphatase